MSMKKGLEQGKVNTIPLDELNENFKEVVDKKRAVISGEKGPFGYLSGPGSPESQKKKKRKLLIDLGTVDFVTSLRGVHETMTYKDSVHSSNKTNTTQSLSKHSIKLQRMEMIEALEAKLVDNSSPQMEAYRNKYARRLETGEDILPEN
jgi:hypothetical protein